MGQPASSKVSAPRRHDSPGPQDLYGTVLFPDLPVDEDVETEVFRACPGGVDLDEAVPGSAVGRDAPTPMLGVSIACVALLVAGCVYWLA